MKLNLKQAISKKSELTQKLKRYNEIMQTHNCSSNNDYNIKEVLAKVKIGNENLELLKLLILNANHDNSMYSKIYQLRSLVTERGNLSALLRRICSRAQLDSGIVVPKISKEEIETEIENLDTLIKTLQDELDVFNLKIVIEYLPK